MTSTFECKSEDYNIKSVVTSSHIYKIPDREKKILAFDFDGVFHDKMKPGQSIETKHRSPDQDFLFNQFMNNPKSLKPYLIKSTLNKIRYALAHKHNVYIVSANSKKLLTPIYGLLQHLKIAIPKKNIIMREQNKSNKLREIKATEFTDDSMINIIKIHAAKSHLTNLQKLIWVWPERQRFYEIDLDKKISLFKIKNWAAKIREDKHIPGVKRIK